ncbi:MAG: phytase [Epsilonproteobacteria bacterium]|nr:phytase [Campylobacterota bacterium]
MKTLLSILFIFLVTGCSTKYVQSPITHSVTADYETSPIIDKGDVVDDPAIWVHPEDSAKSLIIGTHKKGGGLEVYDITGKKIQTLADGKFNNVDLRYGMRVAGKSLDIVAASNRSDDSLALYAVDQKRLRLSAINMKKISTMPKSYGLCMYKDLKTDLLYVFVNSKAGEVKQFQLFAKEDQVDAKLVREFDVGTQTEGCVVDDENNHLYIGEEEVGIWRYSAKPNASNARIMIDGTDSHGYLVSDVEGLALYTLPQGKGYLIASSQGENGYAVYLRENGKYLGKFQIIDGEIDGTSETDGIAVTSSSIGSQFSKGILVVQDGEDLPSNRQNFKIIDMQKVLNTLQLVE